MKKTLLLITLNILSLSLIFAFPMRDCTIVQGYHHKISGTDIDYGSHVKTATKAMIVRSAKERQVMEWQSDALPKTLKSEVNFVFTAATSNMYLGGVSPEFVLYANDKKIATFQIPHHQGWSVKGNDKSTLTFEQVSQNGSGDRFGYMYLTMPSNPLGKEKPVTFRIENTEGGSNSWVMIFQAPIQQGVTAIATAGILKSNGKQVVDIDYSHFGMPTKAEIELGNTKLQQNVQLGINKIKLYIDPAKKEYNDIVTVTTAEGSATTPLVLKPTKEWSVNFVQHSHTDIGYTRAQHEILSEHLRFIDYALDYCDMTDSYPVDAQFRWTCEASWAVSEYLRTRPVKQIERLKRRINEGRIEVTAMYFNYDELPGEQELAYSLYPIKQFKDAGINVQLAMQNDVNGIAWNLSELFPDLGVKYVTMGTHGHKALISFDTPTAFWWISPSGKATLTYRAEHYHHGNKLNVEKGNFENFESQMLEYLYTLEQKNYPYDIASIQYSGYLTDNSPPSIAGSTMIKLWNEKYAFPKLRQAVASEFMVDIEKRYGNTLQRYQAAWPDWWTDGFGSAAREVSMARFTQTDLIANQIALSTSKLLGSEIATSVNLEINEANKALLFFGEHTFGFHNSVRDPFGKETMEQRAHKGAYAWESYRRSRPIGETAWGLLQDYIHRDKRYASIAVFNPMNWAYSGQTIIYADHEVIPSDKLVTISDKDGKPIKMQRLRTYADASYWTLWVDTISPLSLTSYNINVTDTPRMTIERKLSENQVIDNPWYRITMDIKRGVISEWFDKELNMNLLSTNSMWKLGELIYERDDVRGALDAFRPGKFERVTPTDITYLGMTKGDIWDTYTFTGTSAAGMDTNNFSFEIRVYKTSKQINFNYKLKKKLVTAPEALYVAFPFELENGKIFFDVAGGVIEAGVDQIPGSSNDWNNVQNFASVRSPKGQIVMGSPEVPMMQFGNINLGRFKPDSKPETNHIFSWPMNNYWVTNFNADQHGEFEWNYYMTSSKDNSIAKATKFAWDNRIPLQSRIFSAGVSNNIQQPSGSIITIDEHNILIVNMSPQMNENAIVVQLREIAGIDSPISISSKYQPSMKVYNCDANGKIMDSKKIDIKGKETKFIKLVLD
ncbi:MAG: hypothetical protein RL662_972 [Bacteroidota bacterium]|jgi:hypothetical protein